MRRGCSVARLFLHVTAVVLATAAVTHAQGRGGRATTAAAAAAVKQPPVTTSVPESNRRVGIDLSRLKASSILVERPSGAASSVDPSRATLMIQPWQYVAAKTRDDVARVESPGAEDAYALPIVLTTADESGRQLDLEVVVAVENGLMLRGADGTYSGNVFVGLLNRENRGSSEPLGAPVHVLLSGQVDGFDPGAGVAINHTNQPFAQVTVRARPFDDQIVLTARASVDPDGSQVPVRVVRPRLILTTSPNRIQGFGLETADLTVRSEGLPNPGGRSVTLVAPDSGRLEPAGPLTLDAQGVATARFRSGGIGTSSLTASADGLRDSDPWTVSFLWPLTFLLAAVLGGCVGTYLRYSTRKTRAKVDWVRVALTGAIKGLVVAVFYAVGINLTGLSPDARAGEALVFVIAVAGAWVQLGGFGKKSTT